MSSPLGSGDPADVRPQAVVAATETELGRPPLQLDTGVDLLHVAPGDAHAAAAADPAREPADESGALRPVAGADEDRDHVVALDGQVVDVAAAPPVVVEKLTIQHLQADVALAAQS